MKCAWSAFLAVVPQRLRDEVDKLGREELEELRLRCGRPTELIISGKSVFLKTAATAEDIQFVVNSASRYSPWTAATAADGYITAPGGHRIGLCGSCVVQNGQVTGIRTADSLCMRVARDFPGIAGTFPTRGSALIIGPPGTGKTTLLRDAVRMRSSTGDSVCVVDERGELFPDIRIFDTGERTDVLTGCSKAQGVLMALKTMGPKCIAVDEITAEEDCRALENALWCGVELLATAHAGNLQALKARNIYRPLVESGLFENVIVLNRDKSWHLERMSECT